MELPNISYNLKHHRICEVMLDGEVLGRVQSSATTAEFDALLETIYWKGYCAAKRETIADLNGLIGDDE